MNIDVVNFVSVWMPEIFLNFIIGLLIWKGRGALKEKHIIIKLLISSILIPILLYFAKINIPNVIITTLITISAYSLFFKFLWKANVRYSVLSSILMMFVIMIPEIATVQLISEFIEGMIEKHSFFSVMFIWTLPTRILQLITIPTLYINKITFKSNKLLCAPWQELSKSEQIIIFILLRHLIVSIILSSCYTQIFKLGMKGIIQIEPIKSILYLVLLCSIYFLFSALQLLFRQASLEDFKLVFSQGTSKLFKVMLEAGDDEQIADYQLQLTQYKREKEGG